MRLEIRRRTLRLARPFETAGGTISSRELLLVELTAADGASGYGEAAPLPGYSGVGLEQTLAALEECRPLLADADDDTLAPEQLIARCAERCAVPAALAALDLAVWDLAGRRRGRPVAELLAERPADRVEVNATVAVLDRAGVAEQAAAAVREGFGCVKVKVGVGDDAGRVAAARAALGPGPALRLDANGAWDVEGAARAIAALAPAGPELVEEPVRGVQAMRALRERVAVRVAMDETASEPGAVDSGAADAVCLKVVRCGGISALLRDAALARGAGAEVYLASTLDGPLGIAAALHAAAALAERGSLAPCGLATLRLLEGIGDPLPVDRGAIALPRRPGLGVDPF